MASRLAFNIFRRLSAFIMCWCPRCWREQASTAVAVVVVKVEHGMWGACADVVWPEVTNKKKPWNLSNLSQSFFYCFRSPFRLQNSTAMCPLPTHGVLWLGMWKILVVVASHFVLAASFVVTRRRLLLWRVSATAKSENEKNVNFLSLLAIGMEFSYLHN